MSGKAGHAQSVLTGGHATLFAGAAIEIRPVRITAVRVWRNYAHGRPALLRRQIGQGALILSTYPLEAMAAASPGRTPTPRSPSTTHWLCTPGSGARSASLTLDQITLPPFGIEILKILDG